MLSRLASVLAFLGVRLGCSAQQGSVAVPAAETAREEGRVLFENEKVMLFRGKEKTRPATGMV